MNPRAFNVLFVCTANSARSILAEAILNGMGTAHLRAYSAGSRPAGRVNPYALELLQQRNVATAGLRSKSWDEFAAAGAPQLDFVFTVCDNAAGEACPYWPGKPASAHWGVADPAAAEGSDAQKRAAFAAAYALLQQRIARFAALPLHELDAAAIQREAERIGRLGNPGA